MPLDKALSRVFALAATLATDGLLMAAPFRFKWHDCVFSSDSGLCTTDRAVASALFKRMNSHGECYPSKQTVGEFSGVSLKTAERAIKRLEKAGFLAITGKKSIPGRGSVYRTNVYQATLPGDTDSDARPVDNSKALRHNCDALPDKALRQKGQSTASNGAKHYVIAMTHNPPLDPPLEPKEDARFARPVDESTREDEDKPH